MKLSPWRHGPRSVKKGASDWTDADYVTYWRARCVVTAKGCWEWQGPRGHFMSGRTPIKQKGYALTSYRGKGIRLHRKMLELELGRPLGPKMQSCHTCDVPWCINPSHLYESTNRQNHLDGGQRKRMQGQTKTHCKHGHLFTPETTYVDQRGLGASSRHCKVCVRIKTRRNAGWPEHLLNLPPQPLGKRPPGFVINQSPKDSP